MHNITLCRLEVESIVLRRTPQRLRPRSGDQTLLVWMPRRWPSLLMPPQDGIRLKRRV
jgi:hypothetical protein